VHDKYTIDDPEFWAMDWIKFGVYDTPAEVNYIRSKTPQYKVAIIGHS
jgi:hypothetical protein